MTNRYFFTRGFHTQERDEAPYVLPPQASLRTHRIEPEGHARETAAPRKGQPVRRRMGDQLQMVVPTLLDGEVNCSSPSPSEYLDERYPERRCCRRPPGASLGARDSVLINAADSVPADRRVRHYLTDVLVISTAEPVWIQHCSAPVEQTRRCSLNIWPAAGSATATGRRSADIAVTQVTPPKRSIARSTPLLIMRVYDT
jgi:hypothetical protein